MCCRDVTPFVSYWAKLTDFGQLLFSDGTIVQLTDSKTFLVFIKVLVLVLVIFMVLVLVLVIDLILVLVLVLFLVLV